MSRTWFARVVGRSKIRRSLVALSGHHLLNSLAASLLSLYLPIYFYTHFHYSLRLVVLFYVAGHVLYAALIPLGARFFSRFGMRTSLIASTPFLVAYYFLPIFLSEAPLLIALLLLVVEVLFRLLFWIPFHTDFALLSDRDSRGRELALYHSIASLLIAFGPLVGALIISRGGFPILYAIVMLISVASVVPLLSLKAQNEKYSWGYRTTYRNVFSQKNWRLTLGYASRGAEGFIGGVIWPLFFYDLLSGRIIDMGAWASLIVLVSMAMQLVVGHFLDFYPKLKLLKTQSYFTAIGWFLMSFVNSIGQLFAVSTYRNVSGSLTDLSFQAFFYEHAADSGHYIDEYTALQEIASHVGRAVIGIALIASFGWFGLQATFVVAALMTLLVTVVGEQNLGRRVVYAIRT
ncbi:MAG: MFS transporter [bacterium]|nr:MFS transporter [bacterium]